MRIDTNCEGGEMRGLERVCDCIHTNPRKWGFGDRIFESVFQFKTINKTPICPRLVFLNFKFIRIFTCPFFLAIGFMYFFNI